MTHHNYLRRCTWLSSCAVAMMAMSCGMEAERGAPITRTCTVYTQQVG